jgi:hypothetical protein
MPIDDLSVVDGMGIEESSGSVVLMVSDHLDWQDEGSHFEALQNKVNSYLTFIAGGGLLDSYPESRDAPVRIDVVAQHFAPESAGRFLDKLATVLATKEVGFTYKSLPSGY